jgi:uncharacterized membrane protein
MTWRDVALGAFRHWLLTLNVAFGVFLAGAFAAPILAALGFSTASDALYAAYHFACHQWAFRSFFVFGQQPLSLYDPQQLTDLGVDPFTFIGNPSVGWKMAFCERDVAIYVGLLSGGLLYARRRALQPLGFVGYGALILPMALDGVTQLFGWRESTWELRVGTGLLFGLASAWLVLPRLQVAFASPPRANAYSPIAPTALGTNRSQEHVCEPLPPLSPRG